mgnify:FL=1
MSESTIIGNGKASGLIAYLDMLAEKGRVPLPTISNLKTAFKAVMIKVDGDEWHDTDIREMDVADYLSRFQTLTMGTYNQASYNTYRSRIDRAVEWYLTFLNTPGWFPTIKQPRTKKTPKAKPVKNRIEEKSLADISEGEVVDSEASSAISETLNQPVASKLMGFPFPLEDGTIATLYLPPSISEDDFRRLKTFIEALIIRKEP